MPQKIKIIQKIRYRLVYNRAHRLNKRGEGLIQVECQQGKRKIYFSTHTYVKPQNWKQGCVVGTMNDDAMNFALYTMIQNIEHIELEYMRRGVLVTLSMLKEAYREHLSPAAKLKDFGMEVISQSDRKQLTKMNYKTLLNNIEIFRKGVLVTDIDYPFVCAYDRWLRDRVGHNTRISRLRLLRALVYEAKRRDIIDQNPFDRFKIQQMTSKKGYLTMQQLKQLEQLKLTGKEEMVRDAFLIGCYTGLRYSDIISLRKQHFHDDWIVKQMVKTGFTVEIPYTRLFDGKMVSMVRKYGGDIGCLTKEIYDNHSVNVTLKHILEEVQADEKSTFHTSRHTFATLLLQQGVELSAIQKMLGHQKITTTQIYSEIDRDTLINQLFIQEHKNYKRDGKTKEPGDTDQQGLSQHQE